MSAVVANAASFPIGRFAEVVEQVAPAAAGAEGIGDELFQLGAVYVCTSLVGDGHLIGLILIEGLVTDVVAVVLRLYEAGIL